MTKAFHIAIGAIVGATLMSVALLLYGFGFLSIPWTATPRGSPVVRGGSIRGEADPWTPCDGKVCDVNSGYFAEVTHPDTLVLSSIGNGISTLPGLSGWTVNFYDRNNDGIVSDKAAVQLCSENTCGAVGLGPFAFLKTPRDRDFLQVNGKQLRFHNHYYAKCDIDNSKEGYCDHVVLVGIVQNNGGTISQEVKYACGGFPTGHCSVGFPKP